MKDRFSRGALAGGIAGTVLVVASAALAGSGVGDVFNLGQGNTVNATSTLTGNVDGNSQLKIQNGGPGVSLVAVATNGFGAFGQGASGVVGQSTSGTGAAGRSTNGFGVFGEGLFGVAGVSHSSSHAGVSGRNDAGGNAVLARTTGGGVAARGESVDGDGVVAISTSGEGVFGASTTETAVYGLSGGGAGVGGITNGTTLAAIGVSGQAPAGGAGVVGTSGAGGTGVYGKGLNFGYALQANGNAVQDRTSGGWVKAMALINPSAEDRVVRCWSSRVTNAQDCGISVLGSIAEFNVDFGFEVDDRIVSATPFQDGGDVGIASLGPVSSTAIRFRTFYTSVNDIDNDAEGTNAPFFVIVY